MADTKPSFYPRSLQFSIATALEDTPVVCLLGPRQAGKSTLAQRVAPDRAYFNLDEEPFASAAADDPAGFVASLPEQVTLDEVQRVPELMRAIKVAVDRDRRPGRFLLTGSANLLLLPRVSESLAGRMEILHLHPFTESEKEQTSGAFLQAFLDGELKTEIRPTPESAGQKLVTRLLTGGYPEAYARSVPRARIWHRQYLHAVMERDVRDIANVRDVEKMARMIETLASQSAALLNVSNLGNDLDMARATVDQYLAVLQRLFLVRLLPAWHRNRAKRLIKSPKVHLMDSGLAASLMDLQPDDWNARRNRFGALVESFVVQQLSAQAGWTDPALKLYYYRDKDKVEVDCVLTRGSKVWGVEVKASQSVNMADTKGLERLASQVGEDYQGGIVFYAGNSVLRIGEGPHFAVPLAKLWEL